MGLVSAEIRLKLNNQVILISSINNKNSKGQFFSFDVIVGSVIFMLAFFLVSFYWLNAQTQVADHTVDLQREAVRISELLMVNSTIDAVLDPAQSDPDDNILVAYATYTPDPRNIVEHVYIIHVMGVGSHMNGNTHLNTYAFLHLVHLSDDDFGTGVGNRRFYPDVKLMLGIPQYDYYITLEDSDGTILTTCPSLWGDAPRNCAAGIEPPADVREVANAERIVLFRADPASAGPYELTKLRIQVWRN